MSFVDRLTFLQVRRPALPLIIAGILTALAASQALRLKVLTGFESLLPQSKPSVQELKRVAALTSGVSTVFIVIEGGPSTPPEKLREAADALVPELKALGAPWVGSAESGVHEALKFLAPRSGFFLELNRLEALRDDIAGRYRKAVGRATGLLVELDDEAPAASADPIDFASIKESLRIEGADPDRYPGGYYQSKDGRALVVLVRSKVGSGDFDRGEECLARLRQAVAKVELTRLDPHLTVSYSGDLVTSVGEYAAINRDLLDVGVLGAFLIAASILLYYLRLRTVILMLTTIGVGVAWTFGMTQLTVGNLNIATGFLFTIIAGNGINFGIMYMARYLEARRKGADVEAAVALAHRDTWVPTLTAAFAAGVSYGSLAATDFRGFHDFGLIGGVGMVLCWLATYLVLPVLLAVAERLIPLERDFGGPISWLRAKAAGGGVAFGVPFARLAELAPRLITVVGLLVTVAGLVGTVLWIRSDPMEYDLRNLRTDASERADEFRLTKLGDDLTGHVGAAGMAILVDTPAQVPELKRELKARRDAAPAGEKPFEGLHALQDFVPAEQQAKIPVLLEIRKWLLKARERHAVSDADWEQLEPLLPPAELQSFGLADLPESVARAFTETDGTRGRVVYISPTVGATVDDAHYLFRWADSYRETKLPDGAVIRGSGRAVIYADMWRSIVEDVPKAILLSFLGTIVVVLFAFRPGRSTVQVMGALLMGIVWMLGVLVLTKVKLNFLNFVALPVTFGIGVDYSVNIVQRYLREGRGGALVAIRETGGAVVLCSLTTMLGYLALLSSKNFAVRSLGLAAFIGEVACVLASVLVLPAALVWLDRRRADREAQAAGLH